MANAGAPKRDGFVHRPFIHREPPGNFMTSLRTGLWLVLLALWALLAAGCAALPEGAGSQDTLTCTDELGCVAVAADEPVTIGSMVVLSGPNANLGQDAANAIAIALAEFGEIHGHPVNLVSEDSLCSAEGGQTAATRLMANPAVVGVLGTSCSSAATAAMPIVTSAGRSMIAASTTSPSLTNPDRDTGGVWQHGYYRTAHNDRMLGRLAADYAFNQLGARTMATIHDGSIYADLNQAMTVAAFEALGGEVVFQGAVNVGDLDMRPVLIEVATHEPDILLFPIFQPEGNLIVAQARDIPGLENTELMGGNALFSEDFLPNTGEAAVGMYMTGPQIVNDHYDELRRKYVEMHGIPPTSGYHAHMYDAVRMLLDAIAASTRVAADGNLLIGLQAIRDHLDNLEGFDGITGSLTCSETGDCATGEALAMFHIQDLDSWPPAVAPQP